MEFFRFPRTPHLAWLGEGEPRGDKLLTPAEATELLRHRVVVEEKVDGANVGISVDQRGDLRAQNRGSYIEPSERHPQFALLFTWLGTHHATLAAALARDLILFGEWCYALHTARHTRLPDWFLVFDVYDRSRKHFWSTRRRDGLVRRLGLELVPRIAAGRFDLSGLRDLLGPSRIGEGAAEGIYLRVDEGDQLLARAKLVRPEFLQSIDEHWSGRPIVANVLARNDR